VDRFGCPLDRATRQLVPRWNTLALFEVSSVSFHRVAEVRRSDSFRLSVTGWFHGDSLPFAPPLVDLPRHFLSQPVPARLEDLKELVSAPYLSQSVIDHLQSHFQGTGSVALVDWLRPEAHEALFRALNRRGAWYHRGPLTSRSYFALPTVPEAEGRVLVRL